MRSDVTNLSAEPSVLAPLSPEQKERLAEVLDGYLAGLDQIVPPSPDELVRRHPDLAEPLRVYLENLAAIHDAAAGLGCPGADAPSRPAAESIDERRLGDFQLVREIGRGGMGVVYEARQISLERRVALKVLPFAAVLDAKQIARFKNEAQAAAQLQHPNIVPVFAIGAERGMHYYAMQLIDGQPLDRAIAGLRDCAPTRRQQGPRGNGSLSGDPPRTPPGSACRSYLTAKSLNRREYARTVTRLGVQAAEALHAAHEYGVVHRDIKPSNLLLDVDGKLWVTDFGLARCQTDVTLTRTGDVIGTLRYMSPEQTLGQSALVDQRTDIYSLGATLYELLTLQPAFPGDDRAVLLRQIERQEPTPPRQLCPDVPVDLETVVLKAMAKRREDRYTTAREVAEELRRVLDGKPTIAKPPTALERVFRWTRRYHQAVMVLAAVFLLAAIGLTIATLLINREKLRTEERNVRVEAYGRQARQTVDQLGARLAERLADVPGAAQVRRELLQDTLRYYREFVEQAGKDPSLRADLALTYGKIGTITAEIGATADAIAAHQSACAILEELVTAQRSVTEYRRELALCCNHLALLLGRSGSTDEAFHRCRRAIQLQNELVSELPAVARYQADLALSHSNLGLLQSQTARNEEAAASFREAIAIQQRLLDSAPGDPERLRDLAASFNNLSALHAADQPLQAVAHHQQAKAYQEKAVAARPDKLEYQSDLALTYNNLGAAQARARQFPQAAASYEQAMGIQRRLIDLAPAHKSYRRDLAVSCNNLGLLHSGLRQTAEAEKCFQQALRMQTSFLNDDPDDLGARSALGGVHNNLAIVLEQCGRLEEAATAFQLAIEQQRVAHAGAPTVTQYRVFLSKHLYNLGRVLRQLDRPDDAMRAALERKRLWPADPDRLVTVAEELALAGRLVGPNDKSPTIQRQCADATIATLRDAVEAGLKTPADLRSNAAFASLRDRAEFNELIDH